MTTAAGIIIGNEILTGKFADENGPYLVKRLRTLGVDFLRLVTIRDLRDEIADEVRRCSALADHVFTTGGVGPTHDDVTLEGVARAFEVPLVRNEELIGILERFGLPLDASNLRMATVPEGTELLRHGALAYPVLRVRNVYVMPGVPRLFQSKFEAIADLFAGEAVRTDRIYTDEHETDIAERLTACADRHPMVEIGSYPRFGEGAYKVIVTLESRDVAALEAAAGELRALLRVVIP